MRVKGVINSIWNEFVYGGHLLSLGASAILYSTVLIFNKPISIPLLVLGYGINQVIYTYNHFKEAEKDALTNPERAKHVKQKKTKILFIFYLFLVIVSLIFLQDLGTFLFAAFLMAGGIMFTEFFKGLTRKIVGFKTFYASLFWAFLIILSAIYYNINYIPLIILLFLFVYLRFVLSIAFFDIKDIESDKRDFLKTFPVLLGRNKTLSFLHILNFISILPLVLGVYFKILPTFSLSLCLFYFYSFYYLRQAVSKSKNIRKLSYIMVDGEYIFWPLILFLSLIIFL